MDQAQLAEKTVTLYPKPLLIKFAGPIALLMGAAGAVQGVAAFLGAFHFPDLPANFVEIAKFFEIMSKIMLPVGVLYLVTGYLFIKDSPYARWAFIAVLAAGILIPYLLSLWSLEFLQPLLRGQVIPGIIMTATAAWYFFKKENVVRYYNHLIANRSRSSISN